MEVEVWAVLDELGRAVEAEGNPSRPRAAIERYVFNCFLWVQALELDYAGLEEVE